MLPFAIKVIWFCLSFTGIIACWVVLYLFSRAINSRWGPGLYSVFVALMQGIFCLGMIHEMDPFRMPRVFCIVQTFVIYYSAWSLTGVCAAFTFATSSIVLWPPPMRRSASSPLAWKNKYYLPIVVFPLACLSVSLPVLLRVKAIEASDDLHCDASRPEWGRFLGYAGFSMILTIPCLILSAIVAHRVLQLHRNGQQLSHYSCENSTGRFHSRSQLSNERTVTSGWPVNPAISPNNTTPASVDSDIHSTQSIGAGTVVRGTVLCDNLDESPSAPSGTLFSSDERSESWEVMGTIEGGDEVDPRRQIKGMTLPSMTNIAPPPRPNFAQAIWRLILFQMCFFIVQCLAALSTIIDVARQRPTPTPFGSQHVALVLVGWGPAVVLGHLPVIRRQLMFWKK